MACTITKNISESGENPTEDTRRSGQEKTETDTKITGRTTFYLKPMGLRLNITTKCFPNKADVVKYATDTNRNSKEVLPWTTTMRQTK